METICRGGWYLLWLRRLLLVAVILFVGWFYHWTVNPDGRWWRFEKEQSDYYNLLLDGFMDGHLYMKADVSPALLMAENPYDPQKRPSDSALHDASLYKGRYYLYFGPVPLLVLLGPFRLLTGSDLPLPLGLFFFGYAGFLASTALWLMIRRRYFPHTGILVDIGCILALGFASLIPVLLRRSGFWELPIGSAYCFGMLMLLCLYGCLHSARHSTLWYAATGACLGLAIGSRINYIMAVPIMAVPVVAWWRSARLSRRPFCTDRGEWTRVMAGVVPLVTAIGLLGLYNWLRFDDPFEFGHRYQLTSLYYEATVRHVSPDFAPFNLYIYSIYPADWSRFFPFFIVPSTRGFPIAVPSGYYGIESVAGVLVCVPFVLLATLTAWAAWRRPATSPLVAWIAAVAIMIALIGGFLTMYYAAIARYMADFVPSMVLLASVGVLVGERIFAAGVSRLLNGLWRCVWMGLMVVSVTIGMLYSLQMYGVLQKDRALIYSRLSAFMEGMTPWNPRVSGARYGPVELKIRLPRYRDGRREPLLATGYGADRVQVLIEYVDSRQIRVGFSRGERLVQISDAKAVDYDIAHQITIAMGPLYPATRDSFWRSMATDEIERRQRTVQITLDGEVALKTEVPDWGEGARGFVALAHDFELDHRATEREFSGRIEAARRRLDARGGTPTSD